MIKLENARLEELKARSRLIAKLTYLNRRWGHYTYIISQFNVIMQNETEIVWKEGHDKMKKKVRFLCTKYDNKTVEVESVWEGILLSDELLKGKYEEPEVKPVNIGNIQISEAEEKVLKLPSKFTVFENITKQKIEVATEVMMAKMRWDERLKKERNDQEWTEEWEWNQVQNKTVFDPSNNSLNFAKQRVTDIASNRRISVPEPASDKIEISLANAKAKIMQVTDDYIKEKCDSKGTYSKTEC